MGMDATPSQVIDSAIDIDGVWQGNFGTETRGMNTAFAPRIVAF